MIKATPSNEVLSVMLDQVNEKLDEHAQAHKSILETLKSGFDKVTVRQDIANGRTRKNEIMIAMAIGGLSVVTAIGLPILGWALYEITHINEKQDAQIQSAVSNAKQTYLEHNGNVQ